jgi:hypothetical protein
MSAKNTDQKEAALKKASQRGMSRAADALRAADNKIEGWSEMAYDFLCQFARRRAEQNLTFISEDVSKASKEVGPRGQPYVPAPDTDRAWGGIYRRAQREGVIEKTVEKFGRSARRHGSVCIVWRGLPQPTVGAQQ